MPLEQERKDFNGDEPTFPSISYVWTGLPSEHNEKGIAGHDLDAIIKMHEVNQNNPLIFYCLEEHEQFYHDKLKGYPRIEVRAMEAYLRTKETPCAARVQEIIKASLKAENRNTVRDKVTVKNAMSLFLLTEGGYVFDTNVAPSSDKEISFEALTKISFPILCQRLDSARGPRRVPTADCWALYSPEDPSNETHKLAIEIFNNFFEAWQNTQKIPKHYKGKSYFESSDYYQSQGVIIVGAITDFLEQYKELIEPWFYVKHHPYSISFVELQELGIEKTYNNTHKHSQRVKQGDAKESAAMAEDKMVKPIPSDLDTIRACLESEGDMASNLKKLLAGKRLDVNEVYEEFKTPLHIAIQTKKLLYCRILLDFGANPDQRIASYQTPRELIIQNQDDLFREAILLADANSFKMLIKLGAKPSKQIIDVLTSSPLVKDNLENIKILASHAFKNKELDRVIEKVQTTAFEELSAIGTALQNIIIRYPNKIPFITELQQAINTAYDQFINKKEGTQDPAHELKSKAVMIAKQSFDINAKETFCLFPGVDPFAEEIVRQIKLADSRKKTVSNDAPRTQDLNFKRGLGL